MGNCICSNEGQINNLFPSHSLLPFTQLYSFIFPKIAAKDSLKGDYDNFYRCFFQGKNSCAVGSKEHAVQTEPSSAQRAELQAVAVVFQLSANNALHLCTDCHYIFKALQILETVQASGLAISKLKWCSSKFKMSFIREIAMLCGSYQSTSKSSWSIG